MARKYKLLYDELNEYVYLYGLDSAIELIRNAKIQNSEQTSAEVYIDNDYYVKTLFHIVGDEYGITKEELLESKTRDVTEARKICYSIMKHDFKMQYGEIGFLFGKDTSTVCRALSSIIKSILKNHSAKRKYDTIKDQITEIINHYNKKPIHKNGEQFNEPELKKISINLSANC